jgi:hypothetical protein
MRIGSVLTHSGEALFEGMLIALMVVVLMAGTAFAARGGGGGGHNKPGGGTTSGGSFSLEMYVDNNHDGLPNHLDAVTYDVSKIGVPYPYITTTCKQSGVTVMTTFSGYYSQYYFGGQIFPLQSDVWDPTKTTSCTAVESTTSYKLTYTVGL